MRRIDMNKTELINAISEKAGLSKKDSEKALSATVDAITDALVAGDKVQLVGFGAFEVKSRAARIGRNPKTKEAITIPASKTPQFKAGKALKDAVSKYSARKTGKMPQKTRDKPSFEANYSQTGNH